MTTYDKLTPYGKLLADAFDAGEILVWNTPTGRTDSTDPAFCNHGYTDAARVSLINRLRIERGVHPSNVRLIPTPAFDTQKIFAK
jgi:hypothetical protein